MKKSFDSALKEKYAMKGPKTVNPDKVATVMREFKKKKLKSSSGDKVTDKKQAIAIALSEARKK